MNPAHQKCGQNCTSYSSEDDNNSNDSFEATSESDTGNKATQGESCKTPY